MNKKPSKNLSRRQWITGTGVLAASVATASSFSFANEQSNDKQSSEKEQSAWDRLEQGNERFLSGKLKHPHSANAWRKRLVDGQKPFATIIGCSDSRVPPELLFDQGFGDLFVIRVAGNVIDTDVAGSVEYGVDHLGTKVVVVMGHEGCGAVTAALQAEEDLKKEPNEIQKLVGKIKPSIRTFKEDTPFDEKLKLSVPDNVRQSVKQLRAIPDLAKAEKESRTKIVGCVYEIKTGKVRRLQT